MLLSLAAIFLLAGCALWYVDTARRSGGKSHPAVIKTEDAEQTSVPLDGIAAEDTTDEQGSEEDTGAQSAADSPADIELPAIEDDTVDLPRLSPQEPVIPDVKGVEGNPEENKSTSRRSGMLSNLPGAAKRERRAWAQKNGYEYAKSDPYLSAEWLRGVAATGGDVRDVVSGISHGREIYVADISGIPVMALRRQYPSTIVVEARRCTGATEEEQLAQIEAIQAEAEDLIYVGKVSDFLILSTDQLAAERALDVRVQNAYAQLPQEVLSIWFESDWVIVSLDKTASYPQWEQLVEPLAVFADASLVLPPPASDEVELDFSDADPTRSLMLSAAALAEQEETEPELIPKIERQPEPIAMPSRVQWENKGAVEVPQIGSDEVAPIAEELDRKFNTFNGTRIVRDLRGDSSIFDDGTATDDD